MKTQAGVAFFSGGFRTSNHSKIRLMCDLLQETIKTNYENNKKKQKKKISQFLMEIRGFIKSIIQLNHTDALFIRKSN